MEDMQIITLFLARNEDAIRRIEEELPNATNGLQDNIRDIKAKINSRL